MFVARHAAGRCVACAGRVRVRPVAARRRIIADREAAATALARAAPTNREPERDRQRETLNWGSSDPRSRASAAGYARRRRRRGTRRSRRLVRGETLAGLLHLPGGGALDPPRCAPSSGRSAKALRLAPTTACVRRNRRFAAVLCGASGRSTCSRGLRSSVAVRPGAGSAGDRRLYAAARGTFRPLVGASRRVGDPSCRRDRSNTGSTQPSYRTGPARR